MHGRGLDALHTAHNSQPTVRFGREERPQVSRRQSGLVSEQTVHRDRYAWRAVRLLHIQTHLLGEDRRLGCGVLELVVEGRESAVED